MTTSAAASAGGKPVSYDEFWAEPGTPRAHQALIHRYLSERSPAELEQLRQTVRRRITEQEVTFNVLGVPEGTNRPWLLDTMPFVIDRAEWRALGDGLKQRARLIDLVLTDCYGPQRLVEKGFIPAELIYGNPEFLRPAHGWSPIGGHRLVLYATDVGRDASGAFRVYSDRTAAPTGAGYALENRLVLGRVLGDLFREYRIERVSEFFSIVRRTLERLVPQNHGQPRIVLLSSGSHDESSFEHAYLARYLGYELVEGRDLTVRDRAVYLKTLSGLRRVDVVLRRVYDSWCDPLELREESLLGVPGLIGAAAIGHVALANPLGSSLAEAPALRGYLPKIARHLLGEDLLLDDVPSYWCGDREAFRLVSSDIDAHVFKPTFADRSGEPVHPALLSSAERAEFVRRLRAQPGRYVAERWPGLSTMPIWGERDGASASVALRVFLCRDGADYAVMPGGLARLDAAPDGIFLSIESSGTSRDVWISSGDVTGRASLPAMPDQRVELKRGGLDLPSRLLDDLYWLGRYVERADAISRLARAGLERVGFEGGGEEPRALLSIVDALHELGAVPKASEPRGDIPALTLACETLLVGAVVDDASDTNLPASLRRIRELTLGVRSRLSRDAWHVLRRFTSTLDEVPGEHDPDRTGRVIDLIDELLVMLAAVSGTTLDNMVRGHAWLFLDMGRRVERGSLIVSILRALLPPGADRSHMEAALEVADSLLTYRARYLSALQVAPVVDLLLTDDTNPRALAYQVGRMKHHLSRVPRLGDVVRSRAERRVIALESQLLTADIEQACSGDGSGLRQLLEDAATLLWQFSDDVTQTWFSHAASSRSLSRPLWIEEELEEQ